MKTNCLVLMIFVVTLGCHNSDRAKSTDEQTKVNIKSSDFKYPVSNTDVPANFDTPEGAIVALENAYEKKDINLIMSCKDFELEAKVMMRDELKLPPEAITDKSIAVTKNQLSAEFLKEVKEKGIPDQKDVKKRLLKKEVKEPDLVVIEEEFVYPEGHKQTQRMLVGKTAKGWRVLNPID